MSQQSLFIADGAGSDNAALVKITSPTTSDAGVVTRNIDQAEGTTGSAIPTTAMLFGASDGTNLQQLLVESASNRNLRVGLFNGANEASVSAAGALKVDGSSFTQPVSGTITANIGTTNGLALDATLAKLTIAQGASLGSNTQALAGGSVTTAAPTYTTGQISPLSLTTAGALRTDASGTTQPVSGTITANQGGTWTVQPGNTANTTPWLVTVSTALPTGANTIGAVTQASGPWTSNITQFGGSAVSTGTGASGAGIPRVTVANDSNILATQSGSWTVTANIGTSGSLALDATLSAQSIVDNAAFTDGTTRVVPAGFILDEVAGTALSENDAAAARIDSKRAVISVLEDATTRGTRATIKAANTTATASDTALVVAISPASPAAAGIDTTGTLAALGALNNAASVVVAGQNAVGMFLAAGTLIGTIIPEISMDGGTTWAPSLFTDPSTGAVNYTIVFASSNTATTKNIAAAGGSTNVRVRVSAYTSGTANCTLRATQIVNNNNMLVGQYNSALPTITSGYTTYVQTDVNGRIITAPAGTNASTAGFAVGSVVTSATTNTAVRASTYNEQAANAQRSVSSSSANDASAGTGARTIKIIYYDSTGAGPSSETITMNGTTAVNTVSTTICFIESIQVLTAGTTGSNVGTITLFIATAAGGGTLATINATDNQTIWAHHYTPTGKTTYITGLSGNNTNNSNGSVITIRAKSIGVANSAEELVSDYVRVGGGTAQPVRQYGTPIAVVGPARILSYSACEGTASITTRVSFDFYDQ